MLNVGLYSGENNQLYYYKVKLPLCPLPVRYQRQTSTTQTDV